MHHFAVFGIDPSLSSSFMQDLLHGSMPAAFPELQGKKGALFSNIVLPRFMEEEARHDRFDLTAEQHRSIRTFSDGEQKKALLRNLLEGHPDFLVLDNPFDALDESSCRNLQEELRRLSARLFIIQIVKRRHDLLPFITHAVACEEGRLLFAGGIEEYLRRGKTRPHFVLHGTLPPPSCSYGDIADPLVRFEKVSVSYGDRPILRDIDWEVKKGGSGNWWAPTAPARAPC